MTIEELISAHHEQISSLEKIRDAMTTISTDRALALKDVVAALSGERHAEICLTVVIERTKPISIDWRVTIGQSWDKEKHEAEAATLADAYRAIKSPNSSLEKLEEEL